jgi:hypothetical protein
MCLFKLVTRPLSSENLFERHSQPASCARILPEYYCSDTTCARATPVMWAGHIVATCSRWWNVLAVSVQNGRSQSHSNCNVSSVSKYHTMPKMWWVDIQLHVLLTLTSKVNNQIYTLVTLSSSERVPSAHRMVGWMGPTTSLILSRKKFPVCAEELDSIIQVTAYAPYRLGYPCIMWSLLLSMELIIP